jgi:hypothetical protein
VKCFEITILKERRGQKLREFLQRPELKKGQDVTAPTVPRE